MQFLRKIKKGMSNHDDFEERIRRWRRTFHVGEVMPLPPVMPPPPDEEEEEEELQRAIRESIYERTVLEENERLLEQERLELEGNEAVQLLINESLKEQQRIDQAQRLQELKKADEKRQEELRAGQFVTQLDDGDEELASALRASLEEQRRYEERKQAEEFHRRAEVERKRLSESSLAEHHDMELEKALQESLLQPISSNAVPEDNQQSDLFHGPADDPMDEDAELRYKRRTPIILLCSVWSYALSVSFRLLS